MASVEVVDKTETTETMGADLCNADEPLAKRMRALWALRDIGTDEAAASIAAALFDKSALLRHELCYVLGQLRLQSAIPRLEQVLAEDTDCMVRHEAAEAIGAIGSEEGVAILNRYLHDPMPEVSETCQVSLDRIAWLKEHPENDDSKFGTVDPAPAESSQEPVAKLRAKLLDDSLPTFKRYRALFALRNINTPEAVMAIVDALHCGSDLFRHEIAFVLGQLESELAAPALQQVLADKTLHPMVRHEAAEALGSIAADESLPLLETYLTDDVDAVRESCVVATDMHSYWSKFKAPQHHHDEEEAAETN